MSEVFVDLFLIFRSSSKQGLAVINILFWFFFVVFGSFKCFLIVLFWFFFFLIC